jgi:hypothetical protein
MSREIHKKEGCWDSEPILKKLADSGKSQDEILIYLYCVTNMLPKLKEVEDLVDNTCFIYHEGLYAVASKISADEFNEENLKKNLADFEWIKIKASIHEKVIEGIMKNAGVIPFKFGTLFNTEQNLKIMLKEHTKEFKDTLKFLEAKEEWGVKIYCCLEKLKEDLLQEDESLLDIDKEINSSSPGKAFILKKKKEELLSAVVNQKLNEYGQESFERLNQHSIRSCINKLLPKEVTERKEEMILNSAFLVDKDKVREFVNAVDSLKAKYNDKGLNFDCTGPWPAYNFCSIEKEAIQK